MFFKETIKIELLNGNEYLVDVEGRQTNDEFDKWLKHVDITDVSIGEYYTDERITEDHPDFNEIMDEVNNYQFEPSEAIWGELEDSCWE